MFHLGDKVRFSEFYLGNYGGISHLKDKLGEVIRIQIKHIDALVLMESKAGYQMYVNRYGKLDRYECVTMLVKHPDINSTYIVSQFGVDLVDE